MRAAIVIPCYNEALRLDVDALVAFASTSPAADILLVDDGSTDSTWERIQSVVAAAPRHTQALRLPRNRGKGEAVRAGMLALLEQGYDAAGFWDADLATPLAAVAQFRDALDEHAEVDWVIGSRVRLLGRHIERRAVRHYVGRAFATFASVALDLPVYDTQCGAKLFRATAGLRRVLQSPFRSRWIFDVEMIRRLSLLDGVDRKDPSRAILELPLLEWRDVKGSKVRVRDVVRASIDLLRIRYGKHDVSSRAAE